ncbi:hypothetical protein [Candidatus Frankia alpina]|nr:hypothetical protein [Candidatus Frankia alpina]
MTHPTLPRQATDAVPVVSPAAERAQPRESVRRLRAQIAVNARLATEDPVAMTAPARRAFLGKFEALADPDGVLPPDERARRAGHLRKAHMQRLALRSVQARRNTRGRQA